MLDYLEHHIVDHCNLNCAGCSHFSPLAEPWFESLEDFKRDFEELSKIMDVAVIRIMGGEPLLHPQIGQFLIEARKLFPNSIITLVSNGILLSKLKEELLPICNNNKIIIDISNYHVSKQLQEALEGFEYVRVIERSIMYNICLDINGAQNYEEMYKNCSMVQQHCWYFQNGKFYPCAVCANIQHFNKAFGNLITDYNEEEISIPIKGHTEKEIIDFLHTPNPFCKYCNIPQRPSHLYLHHQSQKDIKEWIQE